jgi:hypothetical protein
VFTVNVERYTAHGASTIESFYLIQARQLCYGEYKESKKGRNSGCQGIQKEDILYREQDAIPY